MAVVSVLATGPYDHILDFHQQVCLVANQIDGRKDTYHYTVSEEHLPAVVAAARRHAVTLQQIVTRRDLPPTRVETVDLGDGARVTVSDPVEEYPVLHLAPHGQRWVAKAKGAPDAP